MERRYNQTDTGAPACGPHAVAAMRPEPWMPGGT